MSSLSASDVVGILTACRDVHISSLKFQDLEISFGVPSANLEYVPAKADVDTVPNDSPIDIDPELQKEYDAIMEEEEMNNLMIEDPEAYEDALLAMEEHEVEDLEGDINDES